MYQLTSSMLASLLLMTHGFLGPRLIDFLTTVSPVWSINLQHYRSEAPDGDAEMRGN